MEMVSIEAATVLKENVKQLSVRLQ